MKAYSDLFSVEGKVALVTGGTRGIGYAMAEALLKEGATVYISSRKADACAEAEQKLSQFGSVTAIPADLSDPAECERVIAFISERETKLHLLVNNAGATWGTPFDEFPWEAWNRTMALNVASPFKLTQLARPLLEAASEKDDPARVINVGSIDGLNVPAWENYSYGASKAALHHLTKHMANVLSPSILVNAIAPGPFPTKMLTGMFDEFGEAIIEQSPVGRVGSEDDIAGMILFLSSRASSYVNGAIIPLDGGLSGTATAML